MSTAPDEFGYLAAQAAAIGRASALPAGIRLQADTADGTVSALQLGGAPVDVTFLHGVGLNAHTFDTTILALDAPALSVDLPGHGDSAWRADADYSPATIGAAVAAAIDALTDAPQLLVGQSLGGLTATWIAAHRPDLVRELVIVDITPGIETDGGPEQLQAFFEQIEFPSREAAVDRAQAFGMGGDRPATERGVFFNTRVRPDGIVEWKHHFARLAHDSIAAPLSSSAATRLLPADGWADLAAVTAPITLVRAQGGYISDAALDEFRRRVPAATVIELPATHNVQESAPVDLAAIIRSLLERR